MQTYVSRPLTLLTEKKYRCHGLCYKVPLLACYSFTQSFTFSSQRAFIAMLDTIQSSDSTYDEDIVMLLFYCYLVLLCISFSTTCAICNAHADCSY